VMVQKTKKSAFLAKMRPCQRQSGMYPPNPSPLRS
jgi:hypothetical protein